MNKVFSLASVLYSGGACNEAISPGKQMQSIFKFKLKQLYMIFSPAISPISIEIDASNESLVVNFAKQVSI